jgi:hypothetical protein
VDALGNDLGAEEPPGERPAIASTQKPPEVNSQEGARLQEQDPVAAAGSSEHDLLTIGG